MTVADCKEEYKGLGEEVFGKPRMFCTLRFGVGNRARYRASKLKEVFQDVSARREEYLTDPDRGIMFPSAPGMTKT